MRTQSGLRRVVEKGISLLGIPAALRVLHLRGLLILAYHGIAEERTDDLPWTFISSAEFERQVAFLVRNYRIVRLGDAVRLWQAGRRLPGRSVAITFDDGYRNNLTLAAPVLKRLGAPATVFVTTGYVGRDELLPLDRLSVLLLGARGGSTHALEEADLGPLPLETPEQRIASFETAVAVVKRLSPGVRERYLQRLERDLDVDTAWRLHRERQMRLLTAVELTELVADGMVEVGAHTMSHHILTTSDAAMAQREIEVSRSELGRLAGRPVDLFAYPNGKRPDYGPEHIAMLRRAGFAAAVTTVPGCNRQGDDVFELSRVCVGPELAQDLDRFATKLARLSWRSWS